MKLLVTGGTGQLGSLVVEQLLKLVPADRIAVSVRDPKKAEHLQALGVDVRTANFNDTDSLLTAFEGIDRVLLISTDDMANRVQQHKAVIEAAREKKVSFIVYTSAPKASTSKLSLAADHRATEEAIIASGIPYSILRNNWYLENELSTFQAVQSGAPWIIASGEGKIGWATRRDFAEAAARVLAGEGHDRTLYELSGKLLTQAELSKIFAEATNREVQVQYADGAAYSQILQQAGLPEAVSGFLASLQTQIGEGELEVENSDFERVLGHPTTPLDEAIRQLLGQP
ncbi:NAD(P)-dependent oxidoreductase [Paenibacillus sp. CCS19]|uniref:SDR family oxidoreductase n=1 Tax=Paenibacillus sp. CCS19 TaxID=3158387 RepID=UPI0025698438|nr:SDR family oxidoreductase [Paenibacillus cellulosilyticus]GMK37328.1 NAD(P)-dependent oxidoreductase [Paenibacillus cellulosilyticus]